MTFHTHARCDQCEAMLHVEQEDELLERGWYVLREGTDNQFDLCSPRCVKRWAARMEARVNGEV